ncbi:hypothetical protein J6590_100697 [Homalodisca vitripennis]|nr:hypothetical protein J6590_100697 [Homalodisca vitripennis]
MTVAYSRDRVLFGLQYKSITPFYLATIRPVPSYTARAWYPKSSATRKRLEAFKNPTLLILTGSQWYARNAVILRTIGLPPTHNEPGLLDPLDY